MSLILYGAPLSPFVRKAEVVLREKGIPFESESVNIMPMPDWFKEISPARRIPVLRDESVGKEGRAGTIPDSSAICAFLERKQPEPAVYPTNAFDYGRAVWLEEWADTELAQCIGLGIFRAIMFPKFAGKEPDLETARATWTDKLPRLLDYLEEQLAERAEGSAFLLGATLSIADIAVACQLSQLELVAGRPDATRWPNTAAFLASIPTRESFAPNLAICRKIVKQSYDLNG